MDTEVQQSAFIPVGIEDMIDYGLADGAFLAELKAELAEQQAETDRQWRALPWYVRFARQARFRRWWIEERLSSWLHHRMFPDCDSDGYL